MWVPNIAMVRETISDTLICPIARKPSAASGDNVCAKQGFILFHPQGFQTLAGILLGKIGSR